MAKLIIWSKISVDRRQLQQVVRMQEINAKTRPVQCQRILRWRVSQVQLKCRKEKNSV